VKAYQVDGEDALKSHKRNKRYSKEFKLECATAYLAGEGSYLDLANKFGLRSTCQLRQWVIKYNSHQELKDHDPIPEAYMTSRRKTTLEERQSIVKYCKKHNWNYKETANKYGCSYAQVYNWCKKYKAQGSKGLKDKRGHRLKESDLTETERLKREVEHLRVQNQIKDREIAFLKKVKDLERTWLLDNQSKGK
uniref:helix-turn-helix domain-containing protein n=1 Tax=Lactobacillus acidophilus TaxID=1579 RepID=UPI003F56C589